MCCWTDHEHLGGEEKMEEGSSASKRDSDGLEDYVQAIVGQLVEQGGESKSTAFCIVGTQEGEIRVLR